ncbi:MAG: DUF262 domain-containing HNH endonuclease family protein [Hyphomicrobiaceae bacterium]
MSDFIRASVATVEALFLQPRVIELPWFQRAYAWREDNVLRLVSDVMQAMADPRQRYSLGHIHLAGATSAGNVALVDGHQRAITLAILFAVLRDIAAGDVTIPSSERDAVQQRLQALISFADDGERDGAPPWRLLTQPQMADFFRAYVQEPGATLIDPAEDLAELSPAERNLINNRDRLLDVLGPAKLSPTKRMQFCDFLLSHCHVVVVEVDNEDEAWSMLGIQQTTRMQHDASEQSKIAIIYSMPKADQEEAARIWESEQARLANERLNELLEHLRTQRIRQRSTKPLEGELQQLYKLNLGGTEFMKTIFRPHADAMRLIDGRQLGTGVMATIINGHVEVLSWLDHRQWVAPALAWLTTHGGLHRETEMFFAHLDRLSWMLRLAGTDPHEQETRFIRLTMAVHSGASVKEWPEFEISEKTIDEAQAILRSRTFYFKHMSKLVLRRLCYQLGQDPGHIDGERITVEHILPRKPPKDRLWHKDFGSIAGIKEYADRLGNMALLTGPINRKLDTKDWHLKRAILLGHVADGNFKFLLAAEATEYAQWTPQVIKARTEKLIGVLFQYWGLPVTPA